VILRDFVLWLSSSLAHSLAFAICNPGHVMVSRPSARLLRMVVVP
jgi:hypothetical protein